MAFGTTGSPVSVVGTHSGFVGLFTQDSLPAGMLSTGSALLDGGGNLRAYTDSTKATQLPLEVVTCGVGAVPVAQLWVRFPSFSQSSSVYFEADVVATTQPPVNDPFGRNAVRPNSLFHLHLNDNTYEDVTGNNRFGVANSSPVQTADNHPFGGEWTLFDGSNDYLTLNNSAGVGTNLSEFTISVIHRGVTSTNDGGLINAFATDSIAGSEIGLRSTTTRLKGGGSGIAFGTADGVPPPADNTTNWLMLSLTSDGLRAYKNGVQIAFKAGVPNPVQGNTPVSIGSYYDFTSKWCENAYMAEAYISNQYTPVEDAKLAYDNQSAPDTFWSFSAWEEQGGGGVTGDAAITINSPSFSVSGSATLPSPAGDIAFSIDKPVFNASGDATLPQPSGDISITIGSPSFASSGSATLPQPSGDISITVDAPIFNAAGSAAVPFPQGDIAFTINAPLFSATGSATQPSPSGDITLVIAKPEFSATGSATLPNPTGDVDFTIDKPLFSASGSASLPYPVGNASITIAEPLFSASGSATLPQPSGTIAFDISEPVFYATGTVSGLVVPVGIALTPTFGSNVLKLQASSNIIKL